MRRSRDDRARSQIGHFEEVSHAPNLVAHIKVNVARLDDLTLQDVEVVAGYLTWRPEKPAIERVLLSEIVEQRDADELAYRLRKAFQSGQTQAGYYRLNAEWAHRFKEEQSFCVVEIQPKRRAPSAGTVRTWHLSGLSKLRLKSHRFKRGVLYLVTAFVAFMLTFFGLQTMNVDTGHAASCAILPALWPLGVCMREFMMHSAVEATL